MPKIARVSGEFHLRFANMQLSHRYKTGTSILEPSSAIQKTFLSRRVGASAEIRPFLKVSSKVSGLLPARSPDHFDPGVTPRVLSSSHADLNCEHRLERHKRTVVRSRISHLLPSPSHQNAASTGPSAAHAAALSSSKPASVTFTVPYLNRTADMSAQDSNTSEQGE